MVIARPPLTYWYIREWQRGLRWQNFKVVPEPLHPQAQNHEPLHLRQKKKN